MILGSSTIKEILIVQKESNRNVESNEINIYDGELKENLVVRFFRTTENLYHEKIKKFVI